MTKCSFAELMSLLDIVNTWLYARGSDLALHCKACCVITFETTNLSTQ